MPHRRGRGSVLLHQWRTLRLAPMPRQRRRAPARWIPSMKTLIATNRRWPGRAVAKQHRLTRRCLGRQRSRQGCAFARRHPSTISWPVSTRRQPGSTKRLHRQRQHPRRPTATHQGRIGRAPGMPIRCQTQRTGWTVRQKAPATALPCQSRMQLPATQVRQQEHEPASRRRSRLCLPASRLPQPVREFGMLPRHGWCWLGSCSPRIVSGLGWQRRHQRSPTEKTTPQQSRATEKQHRSRSWPIGMRLLRPAAGQREKHRTADCRKQRCRRAPLNRQRARRQIPRCRTAESSRITPAEAG